MLVPPLRHGRALTGAARPVTCWAVRHLTIVNTVERSGQDEGDQTRLS